MGKKVIIFGSGIAGLMASIECARAGVHVRLVSLFRAASNSLMAEGGINAVLSDEDSTESHFEDTLKSAQGLASEKAIRNLVEAAPEVVQDLYDMGTQFTVKEDGLAQRAFGGQSFNRTCYAQEETGRQITTALRDEVRRYEASGMVVFEQGRLSSLIIEDGCCCGAKILSNTTMETETCYADAVIMATGGLGGLFSCTTAAFHNTADAAGILLSQGVELSNLEFIQFHPTTVKAGSHRILISESARGEGGRLCVLRDGEPYYFLEEAYPELGMKANLLTRDVVARACAAAAAEEGQVYLDVRGVPAEAFEGRLSDTAEDCRVFLNIDPRKDLIPVEPGIHYFMGGVKVDEQHRTNVAHLYAAGECCAQYHGANRLGGNSLLGAAYGGRVAARTAIEEIQQTPQRDFPEDISVPGPPAPGSFPVGAFVEPLNAIMDNALGIVRDEASMQQALGMLSQHPLLKGEPRALLGQAAVMSALARKESRGAHYRSDYPETSDDYQKVSVARVINGEIVVEFQEVK